jgi:hypothetical protein
LGELRGLAQVKMKSLLVVLLALFWITAFAESTKSAPEPVKIGLYIQDIQDLDIKSHSYMMDLYIWFRWENKKIDPSETLEFMNSYDLWGHTRSKEYRTAPALKTGELYQVIRNQGRFSHKLVLEDYPFDEQTIVIEFEDSTKESNLLRYVTEDASIVLNPEMKLPGFQIGKPRIRIVDYSYQTAFGESGPFGNSKYSRVRVEIPIKRPMLTYALKLMLPILCVIFCAALMFLFHPKYVDVRVGIGITALLTIVALQITLNEDLPEIDYLILMDKIYILSYLFVIAGIGLILKTTRMMDNDLEAEAIALDKKSLIYLSIAYWLGIAIVTAWALLR